MMAGPHSTRADRLVIADDLTGACDSAVHFAAAGCYTVMTIAPECAPSEAQVLAFSTESRDLAPAEATGRIWQLAGAMRLQPGDVIFKKIDSTLRGNTGVEIVAALDAFAGEAAVVNPAFPAMGRVVESGFLRVTTDARFRPVEIAGWLRSHGAGTCRHVGAGGIADAIDAGVRFVSLDAVCQDDLVRIAAEVLALGRRILWAGSAGLAAALASHQAGGTAPAMLPLHSGPVLFCIGSDHPVTAEQQQHLLEQRDALLLYAASTTAEHVASALRRGQHVVLRIPRGQIAAQRLCGLISGCRPAALFLSGGDTASLVFRAIGAEAIELRRELMPGVPAGILQGGSFDSALVSTKSGGFGAPGDLVQIADYFHA
ncbi:MAG: four-carbon acid sugar kinase family protein [Acidobacteriia bacterium]|nr:four-carbon acid sugar kinase family protein [Terriglobia bacterium]